MQTYSMSRPRTILINPTLSKRSIVTLPGSKIRRLANLYYCEQSVKLQSCFLLGWLYSIMAKAQWLKVNNGLDTSQIKAANCAG